MSQTKAQLIGVSDDTTTNSSFYPVLVNSDGVGPKTSTTKLDFNPSTGNLSSTTFTGAVVGDVTGNISGSSGSCTGNAATATLATNATNATNAATATNATNVTVAAESTDTTCFPLFATSATGDQAPKSSTNLTFDASAGRLSATFLNSLSDQKLKKDISTIDNAVDKVMQLRGVDYTWKQSEEKSKGVIAQELQKVLPELVSESNDRLSVNYNGIIGVLIEAIKEQQKQIDELKGN